MLSSTSTGFICITIPSPSLKKNTEIRTLPSPAIKISSFLKIPCSKTRSPQTAEKNMSCGVVPNPTNTPSFHHSPKQKRPPPSSTKKMPFTLKFPAVRCSSSFRTRAAVEEGGLIGESSFYELLGISSGGSFDEIKKAYKQLARKYHPDVSPPDRTEEHTRRFIEAQEAYEILSDPSLRAMYDRDLARGLHLAFSSRRRFDEELEERSQWKSCWQDQVAELKRRSINKDSEENLSWGARMRRQRARSTAE